MSKISKSVLYIAFLSIPKTEYSEILNVLCVIQLRPPALFQIIYFNKKRYVKIKLKKCKNFQSCNLFKIIASIRSLVEVGHFDLYKNAILYHEK